MHKVQGTIAPPQQMEVKKKELPYPLQVLRVFVLSFAAVGAVMAGLYGAIRGGVWILNTLNTFLTPGQFFWGILWVGVSLFVFFSILSDAKA